MSSTLQTHADTQKLGKK